MRTLGVTVVALLWALLSGAFPASGAEHVVIISIDGLRPEFYLDAGWPMPTLQQLAREGTAARGAIGVYPSVTYPTHTTILTGALPARHGVYYNSPFEPQGATGRWYWEASSIRVPTLWDAVRAAGLTAASVSWPVSVGAPVEWNIPETWSLSSDRTAIDAIREATTPPGLFEEVESEATGRLTLGNYGADRITRDSRTGDIAAYLLTAEQPALMTIHLTAVDHFEHEDGRDSPRVRRALATVDSAVSQIVDAAEREGLLPTTAFVILGDHGFYDIDTRIAPNVWLVEAGLRGTERGGDDWRATFHTTAASAFLHLAQPGDRETLATVTALLEALPATARARFELLDRSALDRLGAAPEAALGLRLAPGVDATSSAEPPAIRGHGGGNHGFLPEYPEMQTGFVAWGADIPPARTLDEIRLLDVAPLVAHLLGIPFAAPDGTLPQPFAAPAPVDSMVAHIVRALGPELDGQAAIVRYDPGVLPTLRSELSRALEAAGVDVDCLAYGPLEGGSASFSDRLEQTDIYIWLPVSDNAIAYVSDQTTALFDWLGRGRGRQIHFHWADGTRATDGLNLEHDATFDRIYLEALDIDYAALDSRQRAAEARLRSAPIHVTTPAGTDLTFSIGDRAVTRQNGDASAAAMADATVPISREIELPAGALRVAPLEETVDGTLVVPWARFGEGRVEGLRMTFEEGRIVDWSADAGAEHFREALEEQPALTWFRELAIGMNPRLRAPEGDERIPYYGYGAGVVRLSLGNNEELGGNVRGVGTRWLLFTDATVAVGGEPLVRAGHLVDSD